MIERSIHPNTKTLLDAWKRMKANPAMHSADGPNAMDHPGLLESLFVIQHNEAARWTFRSIGTGVTNLLGRDMSGKDFCSLWTGPDRMMMDAFLESVRLDGAPGVVRARGETLTGQRAELEVTLMPLAQTSSSDTSARMIGLYQPLGGESMLKGRPVWRHRISMLVPPDTQKKGPQLKLVTNKA